MNTKPDNWTSLSGVGSRNARFATRELLEHAVASGLGYLVTRSTADETPGARGNLA
jgi:hypothetical protein